MEKSKLFQKITKDKEFDEPWEKNMQKAITDYKKTVDKGWFVE